LCKWEKENQEDLGGLEDLEDLGGSKMEGVSKDVCEVRHEAVNKEVERGARERRRSEDRLSKVEDAVLLLSQIVKRLEKKSFSDKLIIIIAVIVCFLTLVIIFGPEIAVRFLPKP
jgi:hypothetical protein